MSAFILSDCFDGKLVLSADETIVKKKLIHMQIHESFELNKVTGYYILSISLVLPIEFIVVMVSVFHDTN